MSLLKLQCSFSAVEDVQVLTPKAEINSGKEYLYLKFEDRHYGLQHPRLVEQMESMVEI